VPGSVYQWVDNVSLPFFYVIRFLRSVNFYIALSYFLVPIPASVTRERLIWLSRVGVKNEGGVERGAGGPEGGGKRCEGRVLAIYFNFYYLF